MKSIKSKVTKSSKSSKIDKINQPLFKPSPLKYSRHGTSHSSFLVNVKSVTLKPLKQSAPSERSYESEYEEMSSDYCTLPRKKNKYRIKQSVFEKSLDAIILEARREIIEESSSDEGDNTYVSCNEENIYEELNFKENECEEEVYEEIINIGQRNKQQNFPLARHYNTVLAIL